MTGNLLQDYSTCKFQPDYGFCTFLCQYPATLVMGSLFSMVIIQGLLLIGIIEKKSGFLEPWLFVSFIAIIGLALNFGYVSWFTGLPYIP